MFFCAVHGCYWGAVSHNLTVLLWENCRTEGQKNTGEPSPCVFLLCVLLVSAFYADFVKDLQQVCYSVISFIPAGHINDGFALVHHD